MSDPRDVPNHDLLDEIARDFSEDPAVALGTMFRSPGLRIGGKVFAFLGSRGELIVKVPRHRAIELVDDGTAHQVVMGTRTMREWIELPDDGAASTLDLWRGLAREAYEYVDALRRST